MVAKKEAKKGPSVDEMLAEVEKHVVEDTHALLRTHWQNARDALIQVVEAEKRYDLLYGGGRVTKGKGSDKNLARDDKNRVEEGE